MSQDLFSFDGGEPAEQPAQPASDAQPAEETFDLNSFSSAATAEQAKKKDREKNGKKRTLKILLTAFLVFVITCSLVVSCFFIYVFTAVDGKMSQNLNDLELNFTTTLYVDDGKGNYAEYQRIHGMFNRIWVSYDETAAKAKQESYTGIPQQLANAFVAIEDKRFNSHNGVDWKRTAAAFTNFFLHYSSNYGGSTITQQLVKNLTGDASRKPSRKIREIMRARYLEQTYSKDVILECYLNTIALGHGTYGVEAAANYYFGKSVSELSLAECATLAAITKSPTYYAPDDHPETNKERRLTVLYEMYDQKYITKEEYEAAKKEEVKIISDGSTAEAAINSYFVDALFDEVVDDLVTTYNYDRDYAENLFYSAGYRIYTTMDPKIQSTMELVYTDSDTYGLKSKDGKQIQGAMTVIDYEGNVKGVVGGIGKKVENRGLNRATSAIRQPGSSIKPLSVYALALETNLINYSTIKSDTATNYKGWKPVNADGAYHGSVTIATALERSFNTIPVALVNEMTPQVCYDFITKKMGITTLNSADADLSPLGMGGTNGGLTTLQSAAAYAVFGNGGLYYKPRLYTKVCDQKGNVILNNESAPTMAISQDTATVMNHLLQNVVYGSQGTGKAAADFVPHMKLFAKTGTTNSVNDKWFVGASPYYVGCCWCGYDTPQKISQDGLAIKMWGAVMSKIHSGLKAKNFSDSGYAVKRYYCTHTGQLATDACPSAAVGWYKKDALPGTCESHAGTALGTPKEQKAEDTKSETKDKTAETKKKDSD